MRRAWLIFSLLIFACSSEAPRPLFAGHTESDFKYALNAIVGFVREGQIFCSGVIVDQSIITAAHCVIGEKQLSIGFYHDFLVDSGVFSVTHAAKPLLVDADQDLATVGIADTMPEHTSLLLSVEGPRLGERVYALGHPYGLGYTVTGGDVAVASRVGSPLFPMQRWLVATAPIAPGSSGGALVDDDFRVLGITSFLSGVSISGFVHTESIRRLLVK